MATPEGKVKAKVKRLLNKYHVYFHCPMQNGFGAPSLDFIGCHVGHFFAIETKAAGKKPTDRQRITMGEMARCGGKIFVIDGTGKTCTYAELEAWILATGDLVYGDYEEDESSSIAQTPDDSITVD